LIRSGSAVRAVLRAGDRCRWRGLARTCSARNTRKGPRRCAAAP